MAAAQHKLSRRALLAAACAGAGVVLPRHCEERSDAAIQGPPRAQTPGLLRSARNDGGERYDRWREALARYRGAEAGLEAVAHSEEDDVYDRALGRHGAALARLLRTPAPDLAAVARKLDLILRHSVFELDFALPCLAALQRDVRGFAALALPRRLGT